MQSILSIFLIHRNWRRFHDLAKSDSVEDVLLSAKIHEEMHKAADEYVFQLTNVGEHWKHILAHDILEIKYYKQEHENEDNTAFLHFLNLILHNELDRYGFNVETVYKMIRPHKKVGATHYPLKDYFKPSKAETYLPLIKELTKGKSVRAIFSYLLACEKKNCLQREQH